MCRQVKHLRKHLPAPPAGAPGVRTPELRDEFRLAEVVRVSLPTTSDVFEARAFENPTGHVYLAAGRVVPPGAWAPVV